MTILNAILTINDREVVPVRAVPFVTGGDIGPRCLASILADPQHGFFAYVLGANNVITPLLPKNWGQYKTLLSTNGTNAPDLYDANTLKILPASTFVYWDALWRNHEANFMPDREDIAKLSQAEQENYELQPTAHIPDELVEMVLDGFKNVDTSDRVQRSENRPLPIATSDIAHSFAGLGWDSAEKWMKPLGDKSKWLAACIAIPGSRGGNETRWYPVLVGAALIRRGMANVNHVRGRFQSNPQLKPWLDAWNDYEADNFPSN